MGEHGRLVAGLPYRNSYGDGCCREERIHQQDRWKASQRSGMQARACASLQFFSLPIQSVRRDVSVWGGLLAVDIVVSPGRGPFVFFFVYCARLRGESREHTR